MNIAVLTALIFLTILYFLYEGIFAPPQRTNLKFKILNLKIELLKLRKHSTNPGSEAFDLIENSIEWSLNNLDEVTMASIYLRRWSLTESEPAAIVQDRNDSIEKSGEFRLKEVADSLDGYLYKALLINCPGLFFCITPWILLNHLRNRVVDVYPNRFRELVKTVVVNELPI